MSRRLMEELIRYPAADRNKQPILEVLQQIFIDKKTVTVNTEIDDNRKTYLNFLEIGSATGQHIAHFAQAFPGIRFQPSDVDSQLFGSINAFRREYSLTNVNEPYELDLTEPIEKWRPTANSFDVVYCSNVLHISPWSCAMGLFSGSSRVLRPLGSLIIYGPFAVDGRLTPESNVRFNADLLSRNSEWGIRDTRDLLELARQNNLRLLQMFDMPANNKILYFQKQQ